MTILFRLILCLMLLLCAACGKKGALIPPDGLVPPPVSGLRVVQQGELFRISWLAPEIGVSGQGGTPLAGFRLYRRELRSPGDDCPTCGADELLIRTVELEFLRDVLREGNLFVASDGDVRSGKSYQYRVAAFEQSGAENRDSGRVKRRKVQPPPAPLLRLEEVPAGIMLEWGAVQVKSGTLSGYNVYRLRPGETISFRSLNTVPLTENRYEDLRMEQELRYRYRVRAVALVEGESVESDPSQEVEGRFVLP